MNGTENLTNKEDFAALITSIENDLYNIAKHKIDNINDVEDIIQETIIKVYKNYKNLKNKDCFKAWAIKILLNECKKCYKNRVKETLLLNKIISIHNLNTEDSSIADFESNLHFKELLKCLSTTDQDILIFYYQCNYSIKEIATILNINENTIKSKIKRNKEKIEKIMKGGPNEK